MEKGRLTRGIVLFEPWVTHIAEGKLRFLVRSFNTKMRGRVGIVASRKIDKKWQEENIEFELRRKRTNDNPGIAGSVDIVDVISIDPSKIDEKLTELGGKVYYDYYPKHLIPYVIKGSKLYIWVLRNPHKWAKSRSVANIGIQWAIIDIEDE